MDSIWDIGNSDSNDTPTPDSIPQKGVAHVLGVIGEGALHAGADAAGMAGDVGFDIWQMGKNAMQSHGMGGDEAPGKLVLPGLGPVSQKANESFSQAEQDYTKGNVPTAQNTGEKYANVVSRGIADIWTMGGPETASAKALASGASGAVAAQGTYDVTGSPTAAYAAALIGGAAPHLIPHTSPVAAGMAHPDYEALANRVIPALEGGGTYENPLTNSHSKASGPMQVTPETARDPGYGIKPWDGKTQEDLARVGREKVAVMLHKYDGKIDETLAAYNWGEGNVDAAIAKHGDNWFDYAPAETQKYILDGKMKLGMDSGSTGGSVPPMDPADIATAMGEAHHGPAASEAPDPGNVIDANPMINDKLDAENNKLINDNLDIADRIHRGIDQGIVTEEHLPNVIKARDNILSIRSEFGQDMRPEQLDKTNENIEMLNHAIDRLGGEEPIADKPNVKSSVDTTGGISRIPANEATYPDEGKRGYNAASDVANARLIANHVESGGDLPAARWDQLHQILSDAKTALRKNQNDRELTPKEQEAMKDTISLLERVVERDPRKSEGGGGKEPPNGNEPPQEPPSGSGDGETPDERGLFERMANALKTAKRARTEQTKLYSEERSKRIGEVAKVRQYTSGESGFHAEKAQLEGALPTAEYGPSEHFTQTDIEQLFNHVKNHPALGYYESIAARGGLAKLLQGELPTPSELRLLAKTMPPDLIKGMMKEKSMLSKLADGAASVFNVPKALMASFDLSAPLRQGVLFITRKEFYTSLIPMVRAMASPKYAAAVLDSIHHDPLYPAMEASGLAIPKYQMGHNGGPPLELADHEEPFQTNLAQKIPLVGIGVRASERAYNTFIYKTRADTFRSIYALGRAEGKLWTKEPLRDLSRFINSFTGRGDLGKYNNAAPLLNAGFFSPRLLKSRVDAINPLYYASLDPFVRKQAIKSILGFAAVAATIMGLAKLNGAEVSGDITKADGWKIKIGNTRHDILGGEQQLLRLVSNVAMYTYDKGAQLERTGSIRIRHHDKTASDKIGQFFRNKESPDVSFVHDFFAGTNSIGQHFQMKRELLERVTPMFLQDLNDIHKDGGPIVQAFPGLFGESIQTYQAKKPPVKTGTPPTSGGGIWAM